MDFENYLPRLLEHERQKAMEALKGDLHAQLRVWSGINLNWIADYVCNPAMKWEFRLLDVDCIRFTGTSSEWNEILIRQCERKPAQLRKLLLEDAAICSAITSQLKEERPDPILVRKGDEEATWKVLDGMHRFVKAIVEGKTQVKVFVPTSEDAVRPICEPHVVYDLIKAYERASVRPHFPGTSVTNAELVAALRLLNREYANVEQLLRERFDPGARSMPTNGIESAIQSVIG